MGPWDPVLWSFLLGSLERAPRLCLGRFVSGEPSRFPFRDLGRTSLSTAFPLNQLRAPWGQHLLFSLSHSQRPRVRPELVVPAAGPPGPSWLTFWVLAGACPHRPLGCRPTVVRAQEWKETGSLGGSSLLCVPQPTTV